MTNFGKTLRKAKNSYLGSRLMEIRHRLVYEKSYKRMSQAMRRFKECNNRKPRSQIRKEVKLCKNFWGCYPFHYFRYDLYKREKQLPERELLNYIPEFFFYTLFLSFYDSEKYRILLADKNIAEQVFRSLGIAHPHTICKLIDNHIYTNQLVEMSYDQVEQELTEKQYKEVFVKPVGGPGGYGIYVFNRSANGKYITKAGDIFHREFLNEIGEQDDYIIQSGLIQDPDISKIYPHSVNTCRISTENKHGNVRILCSILRIGRDGWQVDNIGQDGLSLAIDRSTGKIGDHATSEQCECFDRHPDTNFVFKDYQILNWAEIKKFAIESARKLPQFTYLAWDVASTEEGPVATEATLFGFGLDAYQVTLGGLREIFAIDDPQFYWKNRGRRA